MNLLNDPLDETQLNLLAVLQEHPRLDDLQCAAYSSMAISKTREVLATLVERKLVLLGADVYSLDRKALKELLLSA